jgi:hypothetical protein
MRMCPVLCTELGVLSGLPLLPLIDSVVLCTTRVDTIISTIYACVPTKTGHTPVVTLSHTCQCRLNSRFINTVCTRVSPTTPLCAHTPFTILVTPSMYWLADYSRCGAPNCAFVCIIWQSLCVLVFLLFFWHVPKNCSLCGTPMMGTFLLVSVGTDERMYMIWKVYKNIFVSKIITQVFAYECANLSALGKRIRLV